MPNTGVTYLTTTALPLLPLLVLVNHDCLCCAVDSSVCAQVGRMKSGSCREKRVRWRGEKRIENGREKERREERMKCDQTESK